MQKQLKKLSCFYLNTSIDYMKKIMMDAGVEGAPKITFYTSAE